MIQRPGPGWQNRYVIDLKRGIVVNNRNMTNMQDILYYRSFFSNSRPDLSDAEMHEWVLKYELGERLLNSMRVNLNKEAQRVRRLYPLASRIQRFEPFYGQYINLSAPFIRGWRQTANRDWEDQSKVVIYAEQKLAKIRKYGVGLNKREVGVEQAKTLEDSLAERFAREMRKSPSVAAPVEKED